MFDYTHMVDGLTEDFSESGGDVCGDGTVMAQHEAAGELLLADAERMLVR